MTSPKFVNLLMLLLVAFWGTGLGRVIHEWADHHPSAPAMASAAVAPAHGDAPASYSAVELDDHDGCLTCQLLAVGVVAILLAVVMALVGDAPVVAAQRDATLSPRRAAFLPALPNRGPPTALA